MSRRGASDAAADASGPYTRPPMRLPFAVYSRRDLAAITLSCAVVGIAPVWCPWTSGFLYWVIWCTTGLAVAVWLLMLNFFRDPERTTPQGDLLVVAPADGVVKDIEDVDEPTFLGGKASRIGIFLSPLDVHVNRMPMACKVVQVTYSKGKMLPAFDPLAVTQNESAAVCLEVLDGRARMVVRQVTGAVARRIVCPVRPGDRFRAGERYGMIKLGSRTEVWVPKSTPVRWQVKVGDRVRAGETVLGTLEPEAAATR